MSKIINKVFDLRPAAIIDTLDLRRTKYRQIAAYGHYAGELQIALKDMENSGKTNVVGKVVDIEHFILDELKPWQKFKFRLG